MRSEWIPSEDVIAGWIAEIFGHGIRRPGHPADRWAQAWVAERLRGFGVEAVRHEPVPLARWEPRQFRLEVDGQDVPCFPLPHAAGCAPVELPLVHFDPAAPERVRGAAALVDVPRLRLPQAALAAQARFVYDPQDTLPEAVQVLPFGREFQAVMEPALAAGAAAFVGVLSDHPGDSRDHYVPYDGLARPIPGVWVSGSDGARLRARAAVGAARARLAVDVERRPVTDHNVVGELAGADEETVVIGSHHDGPWASAVEDGSGIALVLAQAAYWARLAPSERPHRLVFLLTAGHMCNGAGLRTFLGAHREELARVVLELHLEHAAAEYVRHADGLVATGRAEPRWWFTSRIPPLETAVGAAIEAERLDRSFVLPPTVFGPHPPTDGGLFHLESVPLVNLLAAPFYLFDAMDTLDKIHRPSLVPITRAAVRIVEATRGVSAAAMRASAAEGPGAVGAPQPTRRTTAA